MAAGGGPVTRGTFGRLRQKNGRGLPRGVIGNTSDSGSEESRFEPWRGNFDAWIRRRGSAGILEGWPSGLRRRPAKALGSKGSRGFESHPLRSTALPRPGTPTFGRVAEWLKAHDWKSCGAYTLVGSNPTPSADSKGPPTGPITRSRGVAQFGRALRSGRRGPRFKSGRPDCRPETAAAGHGGPGLRRPRRRDRPSRLPRRGSPNW